MRFKKNLLKIKPYTPGKPIDEVKRELGLSKVIKLASNENPFPPSSKVLAAIKRASLDVNRYPDGGCFKLRAEVSKQLKIKKDQLIFGNGSDEIIVLALRAFAGPQDEVLIAKPTFLVYSIASKVLGAKVKEVPVKNFHYDLPLMKKAITKKTRVICIANPDNPLGTYIKSKDLEDFLKSVRKDILVLIDEAYFELAKAVDYPDSIKLLKKYKNILITRTFSKAYGLAGLRVGYGVGRSELIDVLNRVREPFNVNSIAQEAALACLKDKAYYRRVAKIIADEKEALYVKLSEMGLTYLKSETNFILIDVKNKNAVIAKKLLQKGVIVRNMQAWGLNNFIRITVGTTQENKKLINALKQVLGV